MKTNTVYLADHVELSDEAIMVREKLIEQGLETPMIDTGMSHIGFRTVRREETSDA